jgi:hypothetical protein
MHVNHFLGDYALLSWIGQQLAHTIWAGWWHEHGARLLNGLVTSAAGVLLAIFVVNVWLRRSRLMRRLTPEAANLLWLLLVVVLFGGSALVFSSTVLPSPLANARRLVTTIAALHEPIYTDQFTAGDLAYLSRYRPMNVKSAGSLDERMMKSLLTKRTGCVLVHEPELDQLANDGLHVSAAAYDLLRRQPPGWTVVAQFPSVENPLEHVALICTGSRSRPSGVEVEQHERRPA